MLLALIIICGLAHLVALGYAAKEISGAAKSSNPTGAGFFSSSPASKTRLK